MTRKHLLSCAAVVTGASLLASAALASVTYSTTTGNARLVAALTAAVSGQSVDGNTSFGQLVIGNSSLGGACTGSNVLVTVVLQKPSFSIASKTATLLGVPLSATPSANGTAALANLCDSAGTAIGTGLTVGTSGTDFIVSTTSLTTSVPVSVNSGTITTQ